MQRMTSPGISPAEWRWVIIFSGLLVLITMLPYAWAFASDSPTDSWHFMGMLPNPQDGATYLSKIGEGQRGQWLFTLQYTPETHQGAAINEFYLFLGNFARLIGLSALVMYHVSRLVTGFMMYISIYYLGAVIWPRLRPRRLFFSLIGVGSGLGWLALIFALSYKAGITPDTLPTDLSIPESIPFFATFVNPHFPLAVALIALLASIFVMVFRPGFDQEPALGNGGIAVVLITVALCIVQPQGWVPIGGALILYVAIQTWRIRRIPKMELNWVLLALLPALPFLIYYYAIATSNTAMVIWSKQNSTPSPNPIFYVLGFGLILLVAIPGLGRAFRRFERDGDRFMLVWFVTNVLLLYAPLGLQRRLVIGLIIPIAYFAVRALEDYWFHKISPKWRDAALIALFVFILPSNILSLGIPLFGVSSPQAGITGNQLLPADYAEAINWLRVNARSGQVVLAPPRLSLWIPAYSPLRVVYGHPFETLNATEKLAEVEDWYQGKNCQELLRKYNIRYVVSADLNIENLNGKPEDEYNDACTKTLGTAVKTFDTIAIYEIP
jgi:hypothetical protein